MDRNTPMTRRTLARLGAGAMPMVLGTLAHGAGATFPDRPITIIVGYAPGGAGDLLARLVAQKLGAATGATVIVDNRTGAGGVVGMNAVARAEPDGYTIGLAITAHAINVSLPPRPPYDMVRDLRMISVLTLSNNVLVAHPQVPAGTVQQLLALGRSGKAELSYASSGKGTTQHLSGALLQKLTGVPMTHVPYRGAAPAMADVIGGVVPMMFDAITSAEPHIRAGRVRALAVTGRERSPLLQGVPTMVEAGVKDFVIDGWIGLAAPARTPPPVMAWLGGHLQTVMQAAEMREWVVRQGMATAAWPPDASQRYLDAQVKFWADLVQRTGADQ